jgi:hypothetical protein
VLPRIARSPSSPRAIDGGERSVRPPHARCYGSTSGLSFEASAQKIKFYCRVRSPHRPRSFRIWRFLPFFLSSWRPSHVALSRPSPRPLRLPHLKFDCCVGRAGRVPIDLGLVASIMVIDSSPHPPGDARDFIHRAIRGNRVIPSQWCWFGHHSGITKKHMLMRALFLLSKEHLKMRKGPRSSVPFLQVFCLKALVPSWHKESCGVGFFSLREYPLEILAIMAGSIWLYLLVSLGEIQL